jgi:hypothetical protein
VPVPELFGGFLGRQALARLRTAVTAAAPGTPLAGVYVRANRFQEYPDGTLKGLSCRFIEERGQGVNRQLPELEVTETIHINGFVAQGREDAADLDQLCEQVIQAVLDTLLEDSSFLQLFGWVEGVNAKKLDDSEGKDATEHDWIAFQIELELGGGHTDYKPTSGVPLAIADVQINPNVSGAPSDVTVEAEIDLPQ